MFHTYGTFFLVMQFFSPKLAVYLKIYSRQNGWSLIFDGFSYLFIINSSEVVFEAYNSGQGMAYHEFILNHWRRDNRLVMSVLAVNPILLLILQYDVSYLGYMF
jgi:hypothetical protein